MSGVPPARLRMSRTMLLPIVILALGLLSVALLSPWALLVLLVPLLIAVWVLRVGVTIGDDGIGVQSLIGRREVPWQEVAGLRVGAQARLWLVTTRGTEIRLPVLRARDLARLAALSGGRIDVPAPPAEL